MKNLNMSIELITPDIAKKYLEKNINNRNLRIGKVISYAKIMDAGEWKLNGESIVFNKHDELVNGQHRLHAVIRCNKSILMTVIRGVENDVFIYDRGASRNVTDEFVLSGMSKSIANNSNVAIAKLHYAINGNKSMSDTEVKEFLK